MRAIAVTVNPSNVFSDVCTRQQFLDAIAIPKNKIRLTCDIDMQFSCGSVIGSKRPNPTKWSAFKLNEIELDGNNKTIRRLGCGIYTTGRIKDLSIVGSYTDYISSGLLAVEMDGQSIDPDREQTEPRIKNVYISAVAYNAAGNGPAFVTGHDEFKFENLDVDVFAVSDPGISGMYLIAFLPTFENLALRVVYGFPKTSEGSASLSIPSRYFLPGHQKNPLYYYGSGLSLNLDTAHDVSMSTNISDEWVNELSYVSNSDWSSLASWIVGERRIVRPFAQPGNSTPPMFDSFVKVGGGSALMFPYEVNSFTKSPNSVFDSPKTGGFNGSFSSTRHIGSNVATSSKWHQPKSFNQASTPVQPLPMLKTSIRKNVAELDRFYGFVAPNSTYSVNSWGKSEKWLKDAAGRWFFILPENNAIYRYIKGTKDNFLEAGNSVFVSFLLSEHYTDPRLIFNSWTRTSNLERIISFKTAAVPTKGTSDQFNWGGQREKWFKSGTAWYFVVPNGAVFK